MLRIANESGFPSFFLHFPHLLSSSSTASLISQPNQQPSFNPSLAPTHLADLPTHSANKPISLVRPTSLPPIRPSRPKPQAADPRLRPVLHLNAHSMSTSLGFSGFCGFHSSIQALGFIIEVGAAFLCPLLWFSVDPSFGFF